MNPEPKKWIAKQRDYLLLAAAAVSAAVLYFVVPSGRPARDAAPPEPPTVANVVPARPEPPAATDSGARRDGQEPDAAATDPVATGTTESPRNGPGTARVAIIEAASFQCPACDQLVPMLRAIRDTFPNEVALVFKNNPGSDERAWQAAIAALAAHRQGTFWAYHDRLLSAPAIEEADLLRHARELGLDLVRFAADRKDPALRRQVEEERSALAGFAIGDAPAVIIVGRSLFRPLPFEAVRPAIEEELRIAGGGAVAPGAAVRAAPPLDAGASRRDGGAAGPEEVLGQFNALLGRGGGRRAPADPTRWKAEVSGHEPAKGKPDALVTIVEFSDFECIYCSAVLPALQRIAEKYPDDVRWIWKNMPLESHERALPAALVALAAHQRGRFWALHDRLFASRALDEAALIGRGGEVGLGAQEVKAALHSDKLKALIAQDEALAKRVNARGTPSFFVNGRVLRGNRHFEDFDALVGEEIAYARTLLARGVKRQDLYATLMAEAKGFQALDAAVHSFTLPRRPILGAPKGDIVLVAFVDFESLNCADNATALRELAADPQLKDRLRVVIKQAPHPFHRMAKNAAIAALAAHDQGKFWQLHDKLFANQRYLMPFQLEGYAKEAGLDMQKYKAFVSGSEGSQQLAVDLAEAQAAGVQAAPTVYLNGRRVDPAVGYSAKAFKSLIREHIFKN